MALKQIVRYGFYPENLGAIIEKAKVKSDGIYSFRGLFFLVKNKNVIAVAVDGKILQFAYGFWVVIGQCASGFGSGQEVKAQLKKLQ